MKNNSVEHIYIHVPFCLRKCGYCSFHSDIFSAVAKEKFLVSLHKEIDFWQNHQEIIPKTIYFGGGTPSLLSAKEIQQILKHFNMAQIEEVTLEVNPISIKNRYADDLASTSINRISLGMQSLKETELKLLGRLHDAKQAVSAFENLRNSGFENISLDLIYGLPNQNKEALNFSLEKIIELNPEHISTYCLSLEADVPMYPLKNDIPSDEALAEFYYLIRQKLLDKGYTHYEISNFAKPGFESRHNLCYWNDLPYLGLGPAAAGHIDSFRYTNPSDLNEYCTMIEQKDRNKIEEKISSIDQEKEFIFLALRKAEGLNTKKFTSKFHNDFLQKYKIIIDKFQRQNLLELDGEFIRLSPKAYFISNEILAEFM